MFETFLHINYFDNTGLKRFSLRYFIAQILKNYLSL